MKVVKIYKIVNKETGKVYVGRTTQSLHRRLLQHFSDSGYVFNNTPLYYDMKTYPRESFYIEEIYRFNANNREEMDGVELFFMKELNSLYPNGYNIARMREDKWVEFRKRLEIK